MRMSYFPRQWLWVLCIYLIVLSCDSFMPFPRHWMPTGFLNLGGVVLFPRLLVGEQHVRLLAFAALAGGLTCAAVLVLVTPRKPRSEQSEEKSKEYRPLR